MAATSFATSPLTRATPIPVRRVSGKGTWTGAAPAPVPSSQRGFSVTGDSGSLLDDKKLSTSAFSSSRRRSIAGSPKDEAHSGVHSTSAPAPAATTYGFAAPTSAFSEPSGFTFARPSPAPRPKAPSALTAGVSALTRALSAEKEIPVVLPHPSPAVPSATLFFPGVDLTPLEAAQAEYPVFQTELVVTAYCLASRAHQGHLRKNGETMLSHCIEVGKTLAGLGLDADVVAAGLLHEALEGNETFRSQAEEFMPASVVGVLDRVRTISEMSRLYRQHNSSGAFSEETFRRMLVAMEDVSAVLVKLADRIHNMRTISVLPVERQQALARETLEVYSAVANRLGVWCLKAELEDLAFSVLHPEEYTWLKQAVRMRQDPEALEATINTIKGALQQQGVAYEDISGRPKNLYGIYSKLVKDGKPLTYESLDSVYDLMALRVIVAGKHECYTALRAVQSVYRTMPNRSKDFIKDIKKPNGYQSLHETVHGQGGVPIEVQIRTAKMHYIAEYGFAAHWKYKEKLDSEDEWLEKETQYKRWLTQHKLGVHDKKVRPQGSPPTDSSLKSLGVAYLDAPEAEQRDLLDPFLRHQRFKLQVPVKKEVSVLLQTCDGIESKDYPLGTTAHHIWRELGLGAMPGFALTVNSRLPAGEAALKSGDLVQVLPLETVLSRSPQNDRFSVCSLAAVAEEWAEEEAALEAAAASSSAASGKGLGCAGDVLEVYGRNGMSTWIMGPHVGSAAVPLAGM